jgi:serine/threonine protein kinase
MMWKPGDRVFDEEFTIREFAGAGGCADVYRAHWPAREGGYDVAIKVPRLFRLAEHRPGVFEARERDRNLVRQALNECMQWAKCPKHPLIVEFKALRNQGPHVGLITEWVHGRPLDTVIEQEWDDLWSGGFQIAWRHPALIGLHILDALRIVHRYNILHLDLTAGNVLVRRDNRHVKLTDFGLSSGTRGHQGTGQSIWGQSPGYAAPEVIKGQDASDKSDMFSWGVLMLRLAGSRPSMRRSQATPGTDLAQLPHNATSMQEWMLSGEGPPAWRFPETIRELIRECVAPCPEDRPDANAAAERLRLFIKAETGHRPPEPPQEQPPDAGLIECMELLDKGEEAAFELSREISAGLHQGYLSRGNEERLGWVASKLDLHAIGKNYAGLREHFAVLSRICDDLTTKAYPGQIDRLLCKAMLSLIEQAEARKEPKLLQAVRDMLHARASDVLKPESIQPLLVRVDAADRAISHSGRAAASHDSTSLDALAVIEEPEVIQRILCRAVRSLRESTSGTALRQAKRAVEGLNTCVTDYRGNAGLVQAVLKPLKDAIDGAETEVVGDENARSDGVDAALVKGAVRGLRRLISRSIDPTENADRRRVLSRCHELEHALLPNIPSN